ncbi:MAG: phosphatase PAP2 family protein [Halobacteriota archaeon]
MHPIPLRSVRFWGDALGGSQRWRGPLADDVLLASRGVGEFGVVDTLPDFVVALFGLLTYLGNPWLCLLTISVAYVVGDRLPLGRSRAAFALALGIGAIGATLGLKAMFALPRPPGAMESGFGFPSGHALGTTVFWGGVALVLPVGARWRRLLVASTVVVLVSISRVVIGVHYLVDVVAGVVFGVVLLATVFRVGPGFDTDRRDGPIEAASVTHAFLVALAFALAGTLVTLESELLVGLGTSLGGVVGWRQFGDRVLDASLSRSAAVLGILGLSLPLAAIRGVTLVTVHPVAVVTVATVGLLGLLALPLVGDTLLASVEK